LASKSARSSVIDIYIGNGIKERGATADVLIFMPDCANARTDIGRNSAQKSAQVNVIQNIEHGAVARRSAICAWVCDVVVFVRRRIVLAIVSFNFRAEAIAKASAQTHYAYKTPVKLCTCTSQRPLHWRWTERISVSTGYVGFIQKIHAGPSAKIQPVYRLSLGERRKGNHRRSSQKDISNIDW
jgi:hypothetical protein